MKKSIKKLNLRIESVRTLGTTALADIHGGMTNNNGSQRCSQIPTCITYVGGCEGGCA